MAKINTVKCKNLFPTSFACHPVSKSAQTQNTHHIIYSLSVHARPPMHAPAGWLACAYTRTRRCCYNFYYMNTFAIAHEIRVMNGSACIVESLARQRRVHPRAFQCRKWSVRRAAPPKCSTIGMLNSFSLRLRRAVRVQHWWRFGVTSTSAQACGGLVHFMVDCHSTGSWTPWMQIVVIYGLFWPMFLKCKYTPISVWLTTISQYIWWYWLCHCHLYLSVLMTCI